MSSNLSTRLVPAVENQYWLFWLRLNHDYPVGFQLCFHINRERAYPEKRASMTWAQRLKRVFDIDVTTCCECGGDVKIIASIEDPVVIQKILAHLDDRAGPADLSLLPECRAPPATWLID